MAVDRFSVAFFADHLSTTPRLTTLTWDAIVELLTRCGEATPCTVSGDGQCRGKDCVYKMRSTDGNPMAWSPTDLAGTRADANVRAVSLLVLDLDHISSVDRAKAQAAFAHYTHLWHSTHSHREDDQGFRVVVRLSREVSAGEYHRFYRNAVRFFDVPADPTCKNRSRLYFLPSWPTGAPHEAWDVRGIDLDVDDMLLRDPPESIEARPAVARPAVTESDWDIESEAVQEAIGIIAAVMPARRRHEFALALGGMLRRAGATQEVAHYIILESFTRGGSNNPDARAQTVEHTWQREDDLGLTGFTRVSEIVGAEAAREIGDLFSDASNSSFLAALRPLEEAAVSPSAPAAEPSQAADIPAPVPQVALDYDALKENIKKIRLKKRASKERAQRIEYVLLGRLLKKEQLATVDGENDLETAEEGQRTGIRIIDAVRRTMSILANELPTNVSWEALIPLIGLSLRVNRSDDWFNYARKSFARSRRARERRELENTRQVQERQAAFRATYDPLAPAPASTPAPALPSAPPPVPASAPALPPTREVESRLAALFGGDEPEAPPPLPVATQTPAAQPPVQATLFAPPPSDPQTPPAGNQPPNGVNWRNLLQKDKDGNPTNTESNITLVLRNDPDFCGHIRWNDISKKVCITGGPLQSISALGIEALVTAVQDMLAGVHNMRTKYSDLARRVMSIARQNSFDPLNDYLSSLVWDGTNRMDGWLTRYCGAVEDDDNRQFIQMVGRRWLIALVARGLNPGCKVDNVLVLEGKMGLGKSTVFEIIGKDWFCDTAVTLGDKDSRMLASQYWICELGELVSFKRSGNDVLKNFFSSRVDKFRPPYAASIEEFKRRCIFVGTTNEEQYLGDETGNRKYWTVSCQYSPQSLDLLRRDRDQLLAEAVAAFRAGEKWHFGYEEQHITEEEAEKRMVDRPIASKIHTWWFSMPPLERPDIMTTTQVFEWAFEKNAADAKHADLCIVGSTLRKMGFQRRRDSNGAHRDWRYFPTPELKNTDRIPKRSSGLLTLVGGKT